MVLAIRKRSIYNTPFMILNTISGTVAGKGTSILLGFEEGLDNHSDPIYHDCITDIPGADLFLASTMLYYGLPLFLAVNIVDKGIGAIEYGSSLISGPSKVAKEAERQQQADGRVV